MDKNLFSFKAERRRFWQVAVVVSLVYWVIIDLCFTVWHNALFQLAWAVERRTGVILIGNAEKIAVIGYGLLMMWLVVFYFYKMTRYGEAMVDALNSTLRREEGPVSLPRRLHSLEVQINDLKFTSLRNEYAARQAEQRKNDLVMYLAHDMRTPLTAVIGYLSLLSETADLPALQRQKYISISLDKAYRLEALMEDFFDITRFNLHTIVLEPERVDLELLLEQVAEDFYPQLEEAGKTMELHIAPGLRVYGDRDKLARVFSNLVKNAVSYSYPGTPVVLEAAADPAWVEVKVTNQGRVIAPAKLENIFEKFYRLDESRSAATGGAGLGLAIAREIVVAHGGEIKAQSGTDATVFTVRLPVQAGGEM